MPEHRRSARTAFAWIRGSPRRAGDGSPSLHSRGPLLAERPHSFSVIVGPTGAILERGFVIQELRESAGHRRVEALLRERECFGRPMGKRLCELTPLRPELRIGPHVGHEPDAKRFVRWDRVAGEDHVERAAPADQSWKEERRAGVRHEPDAAPGGTEARRGGGDADIARDRDPEPRSGHHPVNRRDDGLTHLAYRRDRRVIPATELVAEMELAALFD